MCFDKKCDFTSHQLFKFIPYVTNVRTIKIEIKIYEFYQIGLIFQTFCTEFPKHITMYSEETVKSN
jgi:hypothetical protein